MRQWLRWLIRVILPTAIVVPSAAIAASAIARVVLSDSIAPVSADRLVRPALSRVELDQKLQVLISLRLRNYDELEARIAAHQIVPRSELAQRYLPLPADFERVRRWVAAQGLELPLTDAFLTHVVVRGSVEQLSTVFGVSFGRVATPDGELSSALTAPSLPADVAGPVLAVAGLQPHLQGHVNPGRAVAAANLGSLDGAPTPADIQAAYHVPVSFTGAGQTIAILGAAAPSSGDLTAFWQAGGIPQSLGNFTVVNVNGGPSVISPDNTLEATLDVEWAGAMAPAAKIRLYAMTDLYYSSFNLALVQILNELAAHPGLNVVSISFASPENQAGSASTLLAYSQTYALLAASGVSVFVGSGDGGSNPDQSGNGEYSQSAPLMTGYPASDSNVTSVGGTALGFGSDWNEKSESSWFSSTDVTGRDQVGTGGGVSSVFLRPSFQTGVGVPAGAFRCVPDVAAQAEKSFYYFQGHPGTVWGTSLATPIWAGIVADMDQQRAAQSLPALGLFATWCYPLIGSPGFSDILSGIDGYYTAGPFYDLCTGAGSPRAAELLALIDAPPKLDVPPTIVVQPSGAVSIANNTTAVLTCVATAPAALLYQWYFNGLAIGGATSSNLTIRGASTVNVGLYTCVCSNGIGNSVTSNPASLQVVTTSDPGRLVNESVLAPVAAGQNLTVGFYAGHGTAGSMPVLIRGIGPALSDFQVPNPMPDPSIDVVITNQNGDFENNGWGANQAAIEQADRQTGAFELTDPSSHDCALVLPVPINQGTTATLTSESNAAGLALAEIYDDSTPGSYVDGVTLRLINLSAKLQLAQNQSLTAGFVIGGTTAKTVLVRAVGPSLQQFSITAFLPDPVLTLNATAGPLFGVLAANQGWGGSAPLSDAALEAGAFGFIGPQSGDSVILATLPPGNYTAQVNSATGTPGTVLVEVYEIP
ncbi:MAG TPA: protease pro-enzyme activation domain-containing protein [Opitutaceae bacterium]|jgi:kumamolisin